MLTDYENSFTTKLNGKFKSFFPEMVYLYVNLLFQDHGTNFFQLII